VDVSGVESIFISFDKDIALVIIIIGILSIIIGLLKLFKLIKEKKGREVIISYIFLLHGFLFLSLQLIFEHFILLYPEILPTIFFIFAVASFAAFIAYGFSKYLLFAILSSFSISSYILYLLGVSGSIAIAIYYMFSAIAFSVVIIPAGIYLSIKRYPPFCFSLGYALYIFTYIVEKVGEFIVARTGFLYLQYLFNLFRALEIYLYSFIIIFLASSLIFSNEQSVIRGLTRSLTIYIGIIGAGTFLYLYFSKLMAIRLTPNPETAYQLYMSGIPTALFLFAGIIAAAITVSAITSIFIEKYILFKDRPSFYMGLGYLSLAIGLIAYVYLLLFTLEYLTPLGYFYTINYQYQIPYRVYLLSLLIAGSLFSLGSLMILRKESYYYFLSWVTGFAIASLLFTKHIPINILNPLIFMELPLSAFLISLLILFFIPIAIFLRYGFLLYRRGSPAAVITLGIGLSLVIFIIGLFFHIFVLENLLRFFGGALYFFNSVIVYALLLQRGRSRKT